MFTKDQLYGRRWKRRAALHRAKNPLCAVCEAEGKIVAATCVHHVIPVRGANGRCDVNIHWQSPLQSLCDFHHNSIAQQIEKRGYSTEVDASGYPIDERHPVYRANK
jgi:hypothetical protein